MAKRTAILALLISAAVLGASAAKENSEKSIKVGDKTRKYVLYVPDNVAANAPLVFSLHGAAGHDTDRSPFRTDVADREGCIVVYPQGVDQFFPVFGGYIPGWNATGTANEDLDFFKAVIDAVDSRYSIDRSRVYCCGFSNGGMMTYSNASSAADVFAAFASISGFQLNEFHHRPTGARPVPFLHIHGKADDFVKYSCMPVIRDNMIARNGCDPVPEVTVVDGRYRKSVYAAGEGGFPYVYYEIDGMGHNDFTPNTETGNSAQTMWDFMSQYRLDDPCDPTLKWRLNIDTEGFKPKAHHWKVSMDKTRYEYGTQKKENNADNNVYSSLQFEPGDYRLSLCAEGAEGDRVYVRVEDLATGEKLFCKSAAVGADCTIPFSTDAYGEYRLIIVKSDASVQFTTFAFHSTDGAVEPVNCQDDTLPDETTTPDQPETGMLVEIPQDQGRQYDDFTRTAFTPGPEYNTYTANGDLQIAFKMMNVDVAGCDYVVVKYAQPVASGWNLAFWSGQELVGVPAGATEYRFDLEEAMMDSGVLPQICMMTFFGGYQAPLEAKVKGVYKHLTTVPDGITDIDAGHTGVIAVYGLDGRSLRPDTRGLRIERLADGTVRKTIR